MSPLKVNFPGEIPSGITREEADWLELQGRGRTVLELGAYLGLSTVVLGRVARLVVSVDWHQGDAQAGYGDTLAAFWENLGRHQVRNVVIPMVGDVDVAVPLLRRGRFDFAFVDACHDEWTVVRDGTRALGPLRPRGILAFHDYGRWGVTTAVNKMANDLGVGVQRGPDSIAYLQVPADV